MRTSRELSPGFIKISIPSSTLSYLFICLFVCLFDRSSELLASGVRLGIEQNRIG